MKIYHIDRATGVFNGEVTDAQADPLELDLARAAAREPLVAPALRARAEAIHSAQQTVAFAQADLDGSQARLAAIRASAPPPLMESPPELPGEEASPEDHDAYAAALAEYEAVRTAAIDAASQHDKVVDLAKDEIFAAQTAFDAALVDQRRAIEAADAGLAAARAVGEQAARAVSPPRWLLPAFATFDAPPAIPNGKRARLTDDGWVVEPIPPLEPAPEPTEAELASRAMAEIAARIAGLRPLIDQHRDEVDLGLPTTLTADGYRRLLEQVQALRGVPAQAGFPMSIDWPQLAPAGS